MNQTPLKPPGSSASPQASNPFARALAELENQQSTSGGRSTDNLDPFSQAMMDSGGNWADAVDPNNPFANPYAQPNLEEQQRLQAEEAKKARLRKELHDKVNPVDMTDVFNARREQVAKEIDKLREDLQALASEISKFHKEVDITLQTAVSDPGEQGKYYLSFFQQLRALIMLLRQRVQSARTWMQQSQMKSAKKKRRGAAPGMVIDGNAHEQTKTIFDTMHNERSSTYGGS